MGTTDRDAELLRIAERIADGDRVDWERAERESGGAAPKVRHLRAVGRISAAHRDLLDAELPFARWGPLDLKQPVARGGFGEVYRAHERNLDREVALKLLSDDDGRLAATEFVREARRLARVRHPNVVTVHGVDRHEGRLGLWMEWLDGEPLDALVDERGPLGAREAAAIGVELCGALAAVHAAGIVHRDVKLANVVRERGGRIVLMDFGSSTRGGGADELSGTPPYLAPELFEGVDSGRRVDVYALGVLLYRLCSGEYPTPTGGVPEIERAHRERALVPLRERNANLPPAFVEAVERAMAHDPSERFAGVGELERALTACLGGERKPAPWRRRLQWALAALALVAVGALVVRIAFMPGFEAEATFLRSTGVATEERLSDGAQVEPGDQLLLEVDVEQRTWLYVLNADAAGEQYLLFPVQGVEQGNPLPPGVHRIPGMIDGRAVGWDVTSAGGQERLLVVASNRALAVVERAIAGLTAALPGSPLRLAEADVVGTLRGIGGMSPLPQPERAPASAVDTIRAEIGIDRGSRRGVRVWELTLSNPR